MPAVGLAFAGGSLAEVGPMVGKSKLLWQLNVEKASLPGTL